MWKASLLVLCYLLKIHECMPNFGSYPPYGTPLVVRAYPEIGDVQSNLFEIYAGPYPFDLNTMTAIAVIQGEGESTVKGELLFMQRDHPTGPVFIMGNITGLPTGKHGMHIHQSGDMRQGCEKLGEHFNPHMLQHGGPMDPVRHVGDLGNVEAPEGGTAEVKMIDPMMTLSGPRGIIGRSIVIKAEEDDLGRGGTADSITTGSTSKPVACGIIAYVR